MQRLAVVVLLARHRPRKGGRHDAALTVGGLLARVGLTAEEAGLMLKAIAKAAGDNEAADRAQAARDCIRQYANREAARGRPKMAEAFGEEVAAKAAEWLGLDEAEAETRIEPARPLPRRQTLADVHATFRRWFGDEYDLDAADAVCAAAASERLAGDPLWLLLISGPGAAKTETVQSLAGAGALVISTIASEGALLSASPRKGRAKNASGGLLRRIGSRGVIVIKDVTSILSAARETRGGVLAAIREIYDGRWVRNVGSDGGQTLEWTGRVIIVGACTSAWDSAHAVVAAMGDRFVILRVDSNFGRKTSSQRAIRNTGGEARMREELAAAVGGLVAHASTDEVELTESEETRLVKAADIVTMGRTAVERDYRGEVSYAHMPEMPMRFVKQLVQIVRGGVAVGMSREQSMQLAIRCARDSIPPLRLEVLLDLAHNPCSRTIDVRRRITKPWTTTKRELDALHMLGLVACEEEAEEEEAADGAKTTKTKWLYSLAPTLDTAALFELAGMTGASAAFVEVAAQNRQQRSDANGGNKTGLWPYADEVDRRPKPRVRF